MGKIIVTVAMLLLGWQASAGQGPWGRGSIQAYQSYCGKDLCTYDLDWSVRGSSAVVVLEVRGGPESGVVKLFGCSGTSGQQRADWIRRDGAQYIFHLYDSNRCTVDVFYRESATDSVVIQEFAGGGHDGGGGWGDDRLDARRMNCYSDMCEYQMEWSVRGQSSVVTVVDPVTRQEKLFACGTTSGSQIASWIKRDGSRYEFRLYDSDRCSQDVGRYDRPVDRIVVREK